jgi:pimeloyl-ACP methyl ester carboxylesterase
VVGRALYRRGRRPARDRQVFPATGGYEAANTASQIQAVARALELDRPYIVGHDLGAILTYAYVRRFADTIRGAAILDVPMPGIADWDEAVSGFWHIGLFQAPGELAEKLITGRQEVLFDSILNIAKFGRRSVPTTPGSMARHNCTRPSRSTAPSRATLRSMPARRRRSRCR